LALLVYLLCQSKGSATRDRLIDLLWADTDVEAARHALRQTLWYITRRAGESLITTHGPLVNLARPIPSDRNDFLVALERHDLEASVGVYRGDFLPSFSAHTGALNSSIGPISNGKGFVRSS
jgi:DNA-binding SARP family transcriptional activator